ncbi:MAG: sugar phosphate isomerase/epimerase [Pirellula sp.]
MPIETNSISRRNFNHGLSALGLSATLPASAGATTNAKERLKLGIDNFAVRAMKWNDKQLVEYAVKLNVDVLFITDFNAFTSLEDRYLQETRKLAADKGLEIHLGNWSICPTSVRFKNEWGTAEEHLRLGIRAAKALGSPVFRVILGGSADRLTEGGIDARIDDTLKVLKACRSQALDSGIKIAVENHAGDMHSLELVRLIEEAGKDWVGANLDSGNAASTLEDPLVSLENLGPYTIATSLRDVVIWESPNGVTMQWTAMGDGMIDWHKFFARFAQLCQNVPVNIETISGSNRDLPIHQDEFWKAWPKGKPKGYDSFIAMAKQGKPRTANQPPQGSNREESEREYQRTQLERSIHYCKSIGLGRKY